MALRDWVRLPSEWIEQGGLKRLRWGSAETPGADNTAALMLLAVIAHHADDESGVAKLIYDRLCSITELSRAKIAGGLDVLEKLTLVKRAPEGRSTFQLTNYDPTHGWCKLPAKGLYISGRIEAFKGFKLRSVSELDALKLYFLFAARRGRDTNMAHISYEKISDYSGVPANRIKTAISVLASLSLVYVEHLPSATNELGIFNAYRLRGLDSRVHLGTRGRGMEASQFEEDVYRNTDTEGFDAAGVFDD
jgi:hypothetical protein